VFNRNEKESIGIVIFRIMLSLVFLAIGVWAISMAVKGETPAQPLDKPGDGIIMGTFGAMFCAISLVGIVHILFSGYSKGPAVVACLATVVFIMFGLCFLLVVILQPDEIVSSSSINGVEVSRSKGGWGGVVAFSIAGLLPIVFARQIYRKYKQTLAKGSRLPK